MDRYDPASPFFFFSELWSYPQSFKDLGSNTELCAEGFCKISRRKNDANDCLMHDDACTFPESAWTCDVVDSSLPAGRSFLHGSQ